MVNQTPSDQGCEHPPPGWYCSRAPGHEGPCAAYPKVTPKPRCPKPRCRGRVPHSTLLHWLGLRLPDLRCRRELAEEAAGNYFWAQRLASERDRFLVERDEALARIDFLEDDLRRARQQLDNWRASESRSRETKRYKPPVMRGEDGAS